MSDERERARLIATALPSIIPCRISAVGLRTEPSATWSLLLCKDGEPANREETERVLADSESLFEEAFRSPSVLSLGVGGDGGGNRIAPGLERLNVRSVAIAPLMTVESRLGALLVARDGPPLTQDEEIVLSTLGEQSAIGIENLRLSRALQQYSKTVSDLYNHTPVMMHSIDRHKNLVSVNEYWLRVMGYEQAEVLGRPVTDFLTDASRQYVLTNALPRFFETGVLQDLELQFVKKNGETIDVLLSAIAERDHDGAFDRSAAYLVDITDRKRAEKLRHENIYLQEEIKTEHDFEEIIGQSHAIRALLKSVETVATTDATVLIFGETGTGKELIARAIHSISPKKESALVKVNCAALPSGLIESELFGHEKGAFTGAVQRKLGRFELADGGTIFLDEIGDLPLDMQAKLLRVLQEGEFERVGGAKTLTVQVRVIAATNRDLAKAVEEERFRPDLYYRLNVFPVRLPPLRERTDDIPLLVQYFVSKYAKRFRKTVTTIPERTMAALVAYAWPGNIRELENVIERAVILTEGEELTLDEWLPRRGGGPAKAAIPTLDELQRDHIVEVLELTGGRLSGTRGAAAILGLKPTTLASRMKKLGISRKP